jgi:hypothetical protein
MPAVPQCAGKSSVGFLFFKINKGTQTANGVADGPDRSAGSACSAVKKVLGFRV